MTCRTAGLGLLFVTGGFAAVGFLDDLDKVTKASHRGIPGRVRLLIEFVIAAVAVLLIVSRTGTDLYSPFFSNLYVLDGAALLCLRDGADRGLRQCGEPDRRPDGSQPSR